METSAALDFGFRCGFLGLLHLEIIQERLEREFNLNLISTAPSVVYHLKLREGATLELHNPADMPDVMKIEAIDEPWIRATIFTPDEYLGSVLKLCQDRRGLQIDLGYVGSRAKVVYDLPLNEVVFDFYDRLKSISVSYTHLDVYKRQFQWRRRGWSRSCDMSRKGAASGGEDDGVTDGRIARIAVDDRAAQMHLQAVALGELVADAFDGEVEPAAQHPDLLVERGGARRIVEPHLGSGRKLHLDDLEARARPARRDIAAQITASRIAPDRLGVAACQRPVSCTLF